MDPTQEEIVKMRQEIQGRLAGITRDLATLQLICDHPSATKKHAASTGNYDPSADRYWTIFDCPDWEARKAARDGK